MKRETLLAFFESIHRSFYINYNGDLESDYKILIYNGVDFCANINYDDIEFKFDGTEYNIYRDNKIDNDLRWYSASFSVTNLILNMINISQLKDKIEPEKFLSFLNELDVLLLPNQIKYRKLEANVYGDNLTKIKIENAIENEVSVAILIHNISFRLHFTSDGLFLMDKSFQLCEYAVEKIKLYKVMESL